LGPYVALETSIKAIVQYHAEDDDIKATATVVG